MSTWSTCTWGFHSLFFSSVMIITREHSPFLVACVRRETKARNPSPQAFWRETLHYSHFAIMWLVCSTECKQTINTKGKELFGCEQPFLWGGGEHCVTSQKTAAKETRGTSTWMTSNRIWTIEVGFVPFWLKFNLLTEWCHLADGASIFIFIRESSFNMTMGDEDIETRSLKFLAAPLAGVSIF